MKLVEHRPDRQLRKFINCQHRAQMDKEDSEFKLFIQHCFNNDIYLTNNKLYPYLDQNIYQRFYNFIKKNRDKTTEISFDTKGVFKIKFLEYYVRKYQKMGLKLKPKHFFAIDNLPDTVKCLLSGIELCKNCGTVDRHGILPCNYCWTCFKYYDVLDFQCDSCGSSSGNVPDAVKSEQELYIRIKERNIENLLAKIGVDTENNTVYDTFQENFDGITIDDQSSDNDSERSFSPVPSEESEYFNTDTKKTEVMKIDSDSDREDQLLNNSSNKPKKFKYE